jgi:hypothetical protein
MESKDAEKILIKFGSGQKYICSTIRLLFVLCMNTDTLEATTAVLLACKPRNIFRDKCLEEGRRGKKNRSVLRDEFLVKSSRFRDDWTKFEVIKYWNIDNVVVWVEVFFILIDVY